MAAAAISLVGGAPPDLDLEALEAPPDKIIAETAMFLRVAAAVPTSSARARGVSERAHELARALLAHARHARVAVGIAMHPALARDYGAAHIVLARTGYPDPEFDRILTTAVAASTATARERLPHRELEQAWLAWLASGTVPPDELLARTALGRGIDLVTGSRDDVYSLTHALLYATDFASRRPRLPRPRGDVLALAQSALAGALDDDDFDLAGELLLTWPFLGAKWSSVSCFAFTVLARVEDEVGVLPSLSLDGAEYERQPPGARPFYVAATAYHTAYVMGLLCSVMLLRSSRPTIEVRGSSGSALFAEELLLRLVADGRRPQWRQDFEALPPTERAACASFLLDVALRRAVRGLDLASVRCLLERAVEYGVALSPLCAQAAGILSRLAWCSALFPLAGSHGLLDPTS